MLNKSMIEKTQTIVCCQDCSIRRLCLPMILAESQMEHLDSIVQRAQPLMKNEHLFHANDLFQDMYAVRSGSFKTYTISSEGEEQVTGFYLPGEIIGLDAIHDNIHPSYAISLEISAICHIPFKQFERLAIEMPILQHHLLSLLSLEIKEDQKLLLLLNKKNAEQRFAAFLVNLAVRLDRRGFSALRFRFTMTRSDIGNYLGLALETISRVIASLQKQRLISIHIKEVAILDFEKLTQIAGLGCHIECK